jgi:hypothetical protein
MKPTLHTVMTNPALAPCDGRNSHRALLAMMQHPAIREHRVNQIIERLRLINVTNFEDARFLSDLSDEVRALSEAMSRLQPGATAV